MKEKLSNIGQHESEKMAARHAAIDAETKKSYQAYLDYVCISYLTIVGINVVMPNLLSENAKFFVEGWPMWVSGIASIAGLLRPRP
jgi:hypothetical protein